MKTKIEWADDSWNPIRARNRDTGKLGWHCDKPSPGCKNCYAESMNRWRGTGQDYTPKGGERVELFLDEKMLLDPLKWRKPRRIFVCSMTDLFADFVHDEWIDRIFAIAALCPQHQFLILTKRAERVPGYLGGLGRSFARLKAAGPVGFAMEFEGIPLVRWPLRNVTPGFSAENQEWFDKRWADMQVVAEMGWPVWCSAEPLLGPLNIGTAKLSQLVIGGESGRGARPFDIQWPLDLIAQCKAAGVPCFVKQLGGKPYEQPRDEFDRVAASFSFHLKDKKGGDWSEWPEDLRVREYPA